MAEVCIVPMERGHIPRIAEIHQSALKDDFLPRLGLRFLSEVYYPACLENPYAKVFTATEAGVPVGFVNVASDPGRYLKWIVRNNIFGIFRYGILNLLLHPHQAFEAIELGFKGFSPSEPAGEIAFIAVPPAQQGRGIGKKLVNYSNGYLVSSHLGLGFTKTLVSNEFVIEMYKVNWGATTVKEIEIRHKKYVYLAWRLTTAGSPTRPQNTSPVIV